MSGPTKTPTNVLKNRGSWRGDSRSNEPVADMTRPKCPAWLPKRAQSIWRRLVPQLEAMGVLATTDRDALARYCDLYQRYIDIAGMACLGQLEALLKLAPALSRLEKEFGLTPSARAGLSVPATNPQENRGRARFFSKDKHA